MKVLLDTHALVWWLLDDPSLSRKARVAIADSTNRVLVSTISAFEIATKHRLGKWPEVAPLVKLFGPLVLAEQFELLPVSQDHALLAGTFDMLHKDPFDRLLAAQARCEGLILISADTAFDSFPVERLW
jgi:PIN domain nuclease of toxin-antitoxin system